MKNLLITIFILTITNKLQSQDCVVKEDLSNINGKYFDALHFEWPLQKEHWFDELKTPANKLFATKVLTKIETLESNSRKNYNLKGADLKMGFGTPSNAKMYFGKNLLLSYDLNLGCYEYFCHKNKLKVSGEYAIVFRAFVNKPFSGLERAFQFADENPYYEEYKKYSGKFITLCNFLKMNDKMLQINNAKGYYQDIPESSAKFGSRSIFMTRHWYFSKNNIAPILPVTRKEYLEALLVYYDREALNIADKIKEIEKECAGMMKNPAKYPQLYESGKKSLVVRKAKYPDWQKKIELKKAIVQKALKENSTDWLAKPAIVKSKKENFSWKNFYGSSANEYVSIDGYYADTPEDAKNTGAFTFSGFWDDKGGTTLYKHNPEYFKEAEKNQVKPYLIELTYRYINTQLGKSLVENFTENFDFDAIRSLLE